MTFIYALTSPILGDFNRNGYQSETDQQKSCIPENSNKIDPVNLEKSEMQYRYKFMQNG